MRLGTSDGPAILVRADGDAEIGTGHVMRCLALAQAWRKSGGIVYFAAARINTALEKRLLQEEIAITKIKGVVGGKEDVSQTINLAKDCGAAWIVADGYHFGAIYQEQIKAAGLLLLLLDDYGHSEYYCADYILNQNLAIDSAIYARREPTTHLLLGPRYALLRKEFLPWQAWERKIAASGHKILITFGGSDSHNVTGDILQSLADVQIDKLEVVAVIGSSNPHREKLQAMANNHPVSIRLVVDTSNMPELMAWADIAIAAGGTTTWELAFMGLPALVFILADNQRVVAEQLQSAHLARNLGHYEKSSSKQVSLEIKNLLNLTTARIEMSRIGRSLVDGLGRDRVCLHLRKGTLDFRLARHEDSELIWQWANDPTVREVSFSSATIPWEDHVAWFRSMLVDPNCHFWLAFNKNGKAIGQVRFNTNQQEATISVGLDRLHRGRDLGALLIWSASQKLFHELPVVLIHAYIKPDNLASVRAFQKAGFEKTGMTTIKGREALSLQLTRAAAQI